MNARQGCKNPDCDGVLVVYHSRLSEKHRVQSLRCNKCRTPHGKRIVENEMAVELAQIKARLEKLEESLGHRSPISI